jgi:hypothetical protein
MFLREVKRENRNGTRVSYLQLVHNDWDPAARTSRTKILYSFGRTDQVDTAAIWRASHIPDTGPNKVRSGMEVDHCENVVASSVRNSRTRP